MSPFPTKEHSYQRFADELGHVKHGITVPGSFVFEVEGNVLRGWNIDVNGKALDHFTLIKEAGPSTPAET